MKARMTTAALLLQDFDSEMSNTRRTRVGYAYEIRDLAGRAVHLLRGHR
ncbi:MAG: hypothetical protein H0X25_19260 [Acidobacteriales bacterium]|nr:hypothetical protein [Terriglobales bacterium]